MIKNHIIVLKVNVSVLQIRNEIIFDVTKIVIVMIIINHTGWFLMLFPTYIRNNYNYSFREVFDLSTDVNNTDEEIANDIANKLLEEKDDLICKVIKKYMQCF